LRAVLPGRRVPRGRAREQPPPRDAAGPAERPGPGRGRGRGMTSSMQTYIALIRGLGGDYTFPMKELVALLEELGFEDVQTYIQSGNAVFRSKRTAVPRLEQRITAAIEERFGFAPRVIILTPQELAAAVAANPYPEAESAPTSLHLTFQIG